MTNNDVIRSIRYALNLNNKNLRDIILSAGLEVSAKDMDDCMRDEEDPEYLPCDDDIMSHFLDGLIYFKRGKDESRPPQPFELPVTNNVVLKKLRVAFALKEPDMHEVIEMGGYKIGRSELSAFLRKRGQPNYRECGDQVLRYFLKGLSVKFKKN
ncbi:MAG: DUF1456 family protein [Pseudobdellovibrio sp.]